MKKNTSHRLCKLVVLLLTIGMSLYACKSYIPHFPYDEYMRVKASLTNSTLNRTNKGFYQLNIYKNQIKYARTNLFRYTATQLSDNSEKVDSLYLYFIDDHRFYYSRKRKDSIDIAKDIGKGVRLGLYQINKNIKSADSTITMVTLHSAKSKVKDSDEFDFANIYLELKHNNTLKFLTAEYPITMQDRKLPNIMTENQPFNAEYLDSILNTLYAKETRHFDADDMGFHAEWQYNPIPIKTKINDVEFDNVSYLLTAQLTRTYYYNKSKVFEEIIAENPTQSERITW